MSVLGVSVALLQREILQVRASNLTTTLDAPHAGMTQIQVRLVLTNAGPAAMHFPLVTLYTTDPDRGTLFGTFSHSDVQLQPGESRTFSEVTNVTGHVSKVAATLKLFPEEAPSWEASLTPNEPVTWASW